MAEQKRGMGRGLAAILSGGGEAVATAEADAGGELRSIPPAEIKPNPDQPRKRFDEEALVALAESIREQGVIQPVLVRERDGSYELVAGERRWRAAQIAELDEIPAIVRDASDSVSLEVALIENMAREDLNPVEEARACAALVEDLALSREEIGRRVGRSRVAISNLIRLLDLPDDVLTLIEQGQLSEGHGRAILMASDHSERRRLGELAVANGWSVRELERQARSAGEPRAPAAKGADPRSADEVEATASLAAQLERSLARPVAIKSTKRGYRVELSFESFEELAELTAQLSRQPQ